MILEIDPLADSRWPEFLSAHPSASVFHTAGWLRALHRTYGHKLAALVACGPGRELTAGLVFCRLRSAISGRRLISVPFSDHCELLTTDRMQAAELLSQFGETGRAEGCRYVQVRPASNSPFAGDAWNPSQTFFLHRLDLRPGPTTLFEEFHKDCIRRRIRHAEKQNLKASEGRDPESIQEFFGLLVKTRRRHGVPPQPLSWFQNIVECMGQSATVHLARKNGQTIAAILTLRYQKTIYYKYGASDAQFHDLGAIPYLLWRAIEKAVHDGFEELDMGRSDCDNPGLIQFKERWGAQRSLLVYWEFPASRSGRLYQNHLLSSLAHLACRHLPDQYLEGLGKLFYRHIE
jgi:CelD/BcsL family acetyltransferase involved in cellulose biosynthesis